MLLCSSSWISEEEKDSIKSQRLCQGARPRASFMIYGPIVENGEGWSSEVTADRTSFVNLESVLGGGMTEL